MDFQKPQAVATLSINGVTIDFAQQIPAGWNIDVIVIRNTGSVGGSLSGGDTVGGQNFFIDQEFVGSGDNGGFSTISGNFTPDISNNWTIYIHGTWGNGTCDVYIITKKIF